MATTLLISGFTLWPFRYLGRLRLHPPARTQASFKALSCSCNCRRLTCGSFQLTHRSYEDHTVQVRASHGSQNEDKTLLQHSQRCQKGEFREVQGFAESLQHYIKTQISLTSLYGSFSTLNLPYKEVTDFWGLIQCCKDSENSCKHQCTTAITTMWTESSW